MTREFKWYTRKHLFNTKGGSNGRIEKRKRLIHTETKDQNG